MPYFTQRLVDDFASHIRLYRRAAERTSSAPNEGKFLLILHFLYCLEFVT